MEMMGVDKLFVDTNILIYATNETSPLYTLANQALNINRQKEVKLVISPQILKEYLAITTKLIPLNQKENLEKILANIEMFQKEFIVVVDESLMIIKKLKNIVQTIPVGGKQIHDAI